MKGGGLMQAGRIRNSRTPWLLPLAVAVLGVALLWGLFAYRSVPVQQLVPQNGVLDIRDTDLSGGVFEVANSWDSYPSALYTPEDFAVGAVGEPGDGAGAFGTHRLRILAQPNRYYTICGFSVDYATRIYVNGAEVQNFGTVADNPEEFVPGVGYMTLPVFTGETGRVEIIYQYANFVHQEGGSIQPTYLSTPENMEQFKAANDLASLSLSGGLLLLMLYFLLHAALRRKADFLCLALICLLVALRDQNFYVIHLLPPDTSWFFAYRTLTLDIMLLPASILLLLKGIYGKATRNGPLYVYLGLAAVGTVLMLLLPTQALVTVAAAFYWASLPYLLYLLYGVVRHYIRQRRLTLADGFVLCGYGALLAALLYEALLGGRNSAVTRYGATVYGALCFLFLNAAAINHQIRQREAALAESRSRGELLERMNRLNMEFLHKVAHELKTPLTVISGYAQLTGMQLAGGHVDAETPDNLKTIQQEALRLADMVTRLMEYSYGRGSEVAFAPVSVARLLGSVRAIAGPMCLKNRNRFVVVDGPCADVHGSFEMLLQIFINLIVNAGKSTEDGTITVSASDRERERFVLFRVSDTGRGIPPEVLPHIFEQGYSTGGGSGLGLSICLEAVEAHGGEIWVEKTDGSGTVFAFTVLKEVTL